MTILFYPQDVIAVNPKLKGFNSTTFNPVFFPRPEDWTIEGAGEGATAAFASWAPPSNLIPMHTSGYNESNIFGPVYDRLLEYQDWDSKKLIPALATKVTSSDDGKRWVIKLREGVKWHSGEPFTGHSRWRRPGGRDGSGKPPRKPPCPRRQRLLASCEAPDIGLEPQVEMPDRCVGLPASSAEAATVARRSAAP
jgi:Bacterial extracellular solute-binding proteins, family 5 Middle